MVRAGTVSSLIQEASGTAYHSSISLGLQIAQSRSYLYTLGPKVGSIYILGALGYVP